MTGPDGIQQIPEIPQAVFDRSACDRQFETRLETFCRARGQGVGVFHHLRFIKNHQGPIDTTQRELIIAQGFIGGQHQPARLIETIGAVVAACFKRLLNTGLLIFLMGIGWNSLRWRPESRQIRIGLKFDDRIKGVRVGSVGRLDFLLPVIEQAKRRNNQHGRCLVIVYLNLLQILGNRNKRHKGLAQAHIIGQQRAILAELLAG